MCSDPHEEEAARRWKMDLMSSHTHGVIGGNDPAVISRGVCVVFPSLVLGMAAYTLISPVEKAKPLEYDGGPGAIHCCPAAIIIITDMIDRDHRSGDSTQEPPSSSGPCQRGHGVGHVWGRGVKSGPRGLFESLTRPPDIFKRPRYRSV